MPVEMGIRESTAHEAPALSSKVAIVDEQFHVPVPEIDLEQEAKIFGRLDLNTAAKQKLIAKVTSIRHMMTHKTINPMCEICLKERRSNRRPVARAVLIGKPSTSSAT